MRIKLIGEPEEFFKFIADPIRRCEIVNIEPMVVHYWGDSAKEFKKIWDTDKPDFIVTHNRNFIKEFPGKIQAYHVIYGKFNPSESHRVFTNAPDVVSLYYHKLGINAEIISVRRPEKLMLKESLLPRLAGRVRNLSIRFASLMRWA